MAKHLVEGRAFPLHLYSLPHMLGDYLVGSRAVLHRRRRHRGDAQATARPDERRDRVAPRRRPAALHAPAAGARAHRRAPVRPRAAPHESPALHRRRRRKPRAAAVRADPVAAARQAARLRRRARRRRAQSAVRRLRRGGTARRSGLGTYASAAACVEGLVDGGRRLRRGLGPDQQRPRLGEPARPGHALRRNPARRRRRQYRVRMFRPGSNRNRHVDLRTRGAAVHVRRGAPAAGAAVQFC